MFSQTLSVRVVQLAPVFAPRDSVAVRQPTVALPDAVILQGHVVEARGAANPTKAVATESPVASQEIRAVAEDARPAHAVGWALAIQESPVVTALPAVLAARRVARRAAVSRVKDLAVETAAALLERRAVEMEALVVNRAPHAERMDTALPR